MDELKTIFLTNLTEAPIHILAKNDEGGIENVVVAPLEVVSVPAATLQIGGVKQFLDEKRLKQVSAAEAKKLQKEHDGVVESDDE
ncbi:hypothetical protein M977_04403 [Buttiauxella gaviniae ATCC 51604]|uniref:Uncharacterized protein n=1 Tax=Buttiauxella gaviniae ATCC 51604 TaxID=1354253 RepID=A0A1B7HNE7_9ENTR|nr:hypothetical protein [Buttiauxella gaviniae]OAT17157.1 hypothetical protein M977_04403 [Buttiauxella gaviniae ATCC 51604]